ncbi:MAG TPA: hypothetical protein VNI20_03355 [Fimbriimonadaceae bacterium]|nr:hypothetical protein [Fimbriimonadaceae bacterium]
MKRRLLWVCVCVACVVAVALAVSALGLYVGQQGEAMTACVEYLKSHTKTDVVQSDIRTTVPRVVFPQPADKRFRSTCTYHGAKIVLEAKPFQKWEVLSAKGLD